MTISNQQLVTKINQRLATSLTPEATDKITAAAAALQTVVSVPDFPSLPSAVYNTGRLIYVESLREYYYSNGSEWTANFDTQQQSQLWAWGSNISSYGGGQLGDGTTIARSSPVSVIGGFTDWCAIGAGADHSAAIRANGTAWSWGKNSNGQLGDGNAVVLGGPNTSPLSVIGGFTDWSVISAGGGHSLAIRTNGTAWSWGFNGGGDLGDGTVINRSSPVAVVGSIADWCAISTGYRHTLAIRTNGTAWSWGGNNGTLGDGTTTCRSSPVSLIGGFSDWCQVSAGRRHSAAIRTNGTAWTWGCNSQGQLGHNTATTCSRSSPVTVAGGIADWCRISAGTAHSLAIRTNGTAWSWGENIFAGFGGGALGDGTVTDRSSPVSVIGGFTDWCAIAAGRGSSLAIRTNGTAWAWGSNSQGQLGDGTTTSRSSPVSVIGGFSGWCAISASDFNHNLAIRFVRGF